MKILIADKDRQILELVRTRLEIRGYEVSTCEDSVEAVRILDRDRIDLALISSGMERIGTQLLVEVIRKRPHLTSLPVILMTGQEKISELVLTQDRGYDDFLTKPFDPFVLQLRVLLNIEKVQQHNEANALTHLPGNGAIEKNIRQRIEKDEKFSVLYIDISNFKSFNDYYSFSKGDDVIRQTAQILVRTAEVLVQDGSCFVGHIGGDDFIVILKPDKEELFARTFIAEFDHIVPTYYNEVDRERGAIRVINRRGKWESFPVMSCSVAACTNLYRPYKNLGEIARDAMEVKSFLKSQKGSHYLRDRRSEPLGGWEEALKVLAPDIDDDEKDEEMSQPLGQILLQRQLLSEEDLQTALKDHLQSGQKLGEILTARKLIKCEDLGRILEKKLHVPYVSLTHFLPSKEALQLLNRDFIRQRRVVPLEKNETTLRLGMCDPTDRATVNAVRRTTNLEPFPVLITETEFQEFMNRNLQEHVAQENLG